MSRWGLAWAAWGVATAVGLCCLLAYLLRPVVMIPNDRGIPVWPVCRVDTLGTPRLLFLEVRVDQ